jgi:hypothetical protein
MTKSLERQPASVLCCAALFVWLAMPPQEQTRVAMKIWARASAYAYLCVRNTRHKRRQALSSESEASICHHSDTLFPLLGRCQASHLRNADRSRKDAAVGVPSRPRGTRWAFTAPLDINGERMLIFCSFCPHTLLLCASTRQVMRKTLQFDLCISLVTHLLLLAIVLHRALAVEMHCRPLRERPSCRQKMKRCSTLSGREWRTT